MNYHKEMENILKNISGSEKIPTLLLHSCCAPCSSYCLSYLMEFFDISLFYYNPNIYPKEEFEKRLSEQKRLVGILNGKNNISYENNGKEIIKQKKYAIKLVVPEYDHNEFLDVAKGLENEKEGGKRCNECFRLRLEQTYNFAKENNYDYYATTLSVSPHKDAVVLNETGKGIGDSLNKPVYLVSDFKKNDGYKISLILSKKFDIYRQDYCGCEFLTNK